MVTIFIERISNRTIDEERLADRAARSRRRHREARRPCGGQLARDGQRSRPGSFIEGDAQIARMGSRARDDTSIELEFRKAERGVSGAVSQPPLLRQISRNAHGGDGRAGSLKGVPRVRAAEGPCESSSRILRPKARASPLRLPQRIPT